MLPHRLDHRLSLKADIRTLDARIVEYDECAVRESHQLGIESQEDGDAGRCSPSVWVVTWPEQHGVVAGCLDLIH